MADTVTTRTQVVAEVNDFYDKTLLVRAVAYFCHTNWAQVRDIPANAGTDTIKFRRYGNLTAATTALTEGVTPQGSQLSTTDITATVAQYGDYVTLTDVVQLETPDPLLTETAEILGDQLGDTLDQLTRDVLVAGTTVQYANGQAGRSSVTSSDKMNATETRKAVRTLWGNKAKPVTRRIDPNNAYGTTGMRPCFIGIVSHNTHYDLKGDSNFIPTNKYPNQNDVMENEVGAIDEVRFVMTQNAKVFAGAGSGGIDVHATLIMAQNFYGITRIAGNAVKNIIKPLGSAGASDPLDQRGTSGWKAWFVAKRLNEAFAVRVEHAVS